MEVSGEAKERRPVYELMSWLTRGWGRATSRGHLGREGSEL